MTLFELVSYVDTLGPRTNRTLIQAAKDPSEKQVLFDTAYSQMIKIINYVFPYVTKENFATENSRRIPEKQRTMSLEENEKWCALVSRELRTDRQSFKVMYRYVLLMYALHRDSEIFEFYNTLSNMIDSFYHTFPPYLYQQCPYYLYSSDEPICIPTERKTNQNKRESLRQEYLKMIPLIQGDPNFEIIKKGIDAETDMDALLLCPDMDEGQATELIKVESIQELGEKYRVIDNQYSQYHEKALEQYYDYLWHGHDRQDIIQENEFRLIKYLYELYFINLRKKPSIDITAKKYENNWNILSKDERVALQKCVEDLDDENQTYLKYLGQSYMEYGEYDYIKLLKGLSQNHIFEVEKLALEIFRVCHDISTHSKKDCGPEYEKMVYHIRHAYKACCKVELSIFDNQEPDPSDLWLEEITSIAEELTNSMKAKENAE